MTTESIDLIVLMIGHNSNVSNSCRLWKVNDRSPAISAKYFDLVVQ
jgi:hypothetical protein